MSEALRSIQFMQIGCCRVAAPLPVELVNWPATICLIAGVAVVMVLGLVAIRRRA